jgi:glutathione S-transferase
MPMDVLSHKPGQGHTPEALADAKRVQAIWRECLATSGGPFLFGAFSIADAMYAPVVLRFVTYGVAIEPGLEAWADALLALPAMREWLRDSAAESEVVAATEAVA